MNVEGKVAVVTGASRGVGRETAIGLAHCGCAVVVNYCNSQTAAEQVVREAEQAGVRAVAFQGDVAEDSACRALMDFAVAELGGIDILVNNAGTTQFIQHSDLDSVTDEVWDSILGVNLRGPFQCIRAVRPFMEERGTGEVVNVASIAGLSTPGSSVPYGASKAALINMTVNLARALGPTIRVNAVAPGFIDGDWLRSGLGEQFEDVKRFVESKTALQQVCRPVDVAAAILSLIAGSDLVTGHTLVVDGGQIVGPKVS